jgi:aspartate 1-decarboxylase
MIRSLVRSVIHNAVVTQSDAAWPSSLRIDGVLLRAAEILPFEQVEVVNVATGLRFRTYAEPGEDGSGEVRLHHGARAGDTISIIAFGLLHDGQTINHKARVVTLDVKNAIVSITES